MRSKYTSYHITPRQLSNLETKKEVKYGIKTRCSENHHKIWTQFGNFSGEKWGNINICWNQTNSIMVLQHCVWETGYDVIIKKKDIYLAKSVCPYRTCRTHMTYRYRCAGQNVRHSMTSYSGAPRNDHAVATARLALASPKDLFYIALRYYRCRWLSRVLDIRNPEAYRLKNFKSIIWYWIRVLELFKITLLRSIRHLLDLFPPASCEVIKGEEFQKKKEKRSMCLFVLIVSIHRSEQVS